MGLRRGSRSARRGGMPMSGANRSRRRKIRIGIALAAAGAITLGAVADGLAQRGGFGGGGFHGGNFAGGGVSTGGRMPGGGGDGPRNPGGGYPGPRFPGGGGIIVPGGYGGPGTVVVVDDGDGTPVGKRRWTPKKQSHKKQKSPQQMAQRGGFHVPPANERRFVPNEVLLNISTATSARAVDAIAQKYRLTRLDMQDFAMTRHRLARLRINDGRSVAG